MCLSQYTGYANAGVQRLHPQLSTVCLVQRTSGRETRPVLKDTPQLEKHPQLSTVNCLNLVLHLEPLP
jgi:hypothetical protein